MKWEATDETPDGSVHVHPLRDLVAHQLDGAGDCICDPRLEACGVGHMWVHASLDGRERWEWLPVPLQVVAKWWTRRSLSRM